MSEIISQELLNEVLGDGSYCKDELVYKPYIDNVYSKEDNCFEEVNIHELAHKCKEWATKQKFCIASLYDFQESNMWIAMVTTTKSVDVDEIFHCKTEPEAIFKACQWILDNRDKK